MVKPIKKQPFHECIRYRLVEFEDKTFLYCSDYLSEMLLQIREATKAGEKPILQKISKDASDNEKRLIKRLRDAGILREVRTNSSARSFIYVYLDQDINVHHFKTLGYIGAQSASHGELKDKDARFICVDNTYYRLTGQTAALYNNLRLKDVWRVGDLCLETYGGVSTRAFKSYKLLRAMVDAGLAYLGDEETVRFGDNEIFIERSYSLIDHVMVNRLE